MITRYIRIAVVTWMAVMGTICVFIAPAISAQSTMIESSAQATLNERYRAGIETNSKAIEVLVAQRSGERLAVLEDTMFEVKWMGRTVAAALMVQILLQANERRKQR